MPFNSQYVMVNGVSLKVIIEGRGPDVLLVHGFPDDATVWRNQIPVLVAAGYRVIAPDTRGCGDSQLLPNVDDYAMARLVADLLGLLDALGIDKVKLVAHDWGAFQGWHFALMHPERVERYIALSVGHPSAYGRGGLPQKIKGYYILLIQLRGFTELVVRQFNWLMFRIMIQYEKEVPYWKTRLSRPGRFKAGLSYYRANPDIILARDYPRAQIPVVGIWSSGDLFLAEGQMKHTVRYCDAGWIYERIDSANHWMQLDCPEKLNALLLKHLPATSTPT